MVGVAATHLTTILLWSILPSFLTRIALATFYRFFPAYQPSLPPNASPALVDRENARAMRHARIARILLVLAYLVYSVLSTYLAQSPGGHPNFYTLLGLPRPIVEQGGSSVIKSHWRKLARVYHPDKVGKQGEGYFVELKRAIDCLEDDKKRWAYERFGDSVLDWGKNLSLREYVVRGAQGTVAFYLFAGLSIVGLSVFRRDERANGFWRFTTLAATLALEFFLILRATPSPLFSTLIPNRLPFEHVAVLRQLFISVSMAFSQLSPLLFPPDAEEAESSPDLNKTLALRARQDAELLKPLLQKLAQLNAITEAELIQLQSMEMRPLCLRKSEESAKQESQEQQRKREAAIVESLKEHMCDMFEDLRIKSNPESNKVWENAVQAGRQRRDRRRHLPSPSLSPPSTSKAIFEPPPTSPKLDTVTFPEAPKLDFIDVSPDPIVAQEDGPSPVSSDENMLGEAATPLGGLATQPRVPVLPIDMLAEGGSRADDSGIVTSQPQEPAPPAT